MNKVKAIVVMVLLSSALILLFLNGTIPMVISILLSYPNYVIVVADEYYGNPVLQQFVNYKISQGFTVEVKKVSEIYAQYPVSNEVTEFLKVQNFEDIQSDYIRVYALWYDNSTKMYKISAYQGYGILPNGKHPFITVEPPSTPQEVYLYIEGSGARTIYLTFDGGKKLNVSVPNYPYCYTYWGKPKVTVDGKVYFYKTESYSILSYVRTFPSLQYLLLIGNVSRVPSFDLRRIDVASGIIYTGVTDYPYSADDNMNPMFAVGRISVKNSMELELVLTKTMNFKPYMSRKALFVKGASMYIPQDVWNEKYNDFVNYVNQCLINVYNGIQNYQLIEPDRATFIANVNSENCYVIPFAHGFTDAIAFSPSYSFETPDIYSYVNFKNSTIITPISCMVNDFSYITGKQSIGEAFLLDSDSNVPAFIGACLPTNLDSGKNLIKYFYAYIGVKKTIGNSLKSAKSISFTIDYYLIYEKLNWNILGDPSLNLVTATVSIPSYGWLDLSYTVDGVEGTSNVSYIVIFPNGTSKTYVGTRVTVNNCLPGSYTITCVYKTMNQTQTVNVIENQGTTVVFSFTEVKPKVGTIRVYSNIPVVVTVTGPVNVIRVTPFVLSDVPVGTYLLNATYDSISKTHVIVLGEGQDISYTFEFEVYTPSLTSNILSLAFQYLPYMLIGLAGMVLIKR
jgi:hypothetical protein